MGSLHMIAIIYLILWGTQGKEHLKRVRRDPWCWLCWTPGKIFFIIWSLTQNHSQHLTPARVCPAASAEGARGSCHQETSEQSSGCPPKWGADPCQEMGLLNRNQWWKPDGVCVELCVFKNKFSFALVFSSVVQTQRSSKSLAHSMEESPRVSAFM